MHCARVFCRSMCGLFCRKLAKAGKIEADVTGLGYESLRQPKRIRPCDNCAHAIAFPERARDARIYRSVGWWDYPAVVQPNSFIHKVFSNWSFNIAIGCGHACRFCYVPGASTVKQAARLAEHGISDPRCTMGRLLLLRKWMKKRFLASLAAAERTPRRSLPPDGNRPVIYCSTTDPYQVFRHPNAAARAELATASVYLVRRSSN